MVPFFFRNEKSGFEFDSAYKMDSLGAQEVFEASIRWLRDTSFSIALLLTKFKIYLDSWLPSLPGPLSLPSESFYFALPHHSGHLHGIAGSTKNTCILTMRLFILYFFSCEIPHQDFNSRHSLFLIILRVQLTYFHLVYFTS